MISILNDWVLILKFSVSNFTNKYYFLSMFDTSNTDFHKNYIEINVRCAEQLLETACKCFNWFMEQCLKKSTTQLNIK